MRLYKFLKAPRNKLDKLQQLRSLIYDLFVGHFKNSRALFTKDNRSGNVFIRVELCFDTLTRYQ